MTAESIDYHEACARVCAPGTNFEITHADVRGFETKVFANAARNLAEFFAVAIDRDAELIVYEDERWTSAEVMALAAQIAHTLVDRFGVQKGDRIAIICRNYPEWPAVHVATVSIGAIIVPMNAWWQPDEIDYALGDCEPKVVFADAERMTRIDSIQSENRPTNLVGLRCDNDQLAAGGVRLEDVLDERSHFPVADVDPDDDASILYTSGTTGHPKGAVSTHRAVIHALMAYTSRAMVNALTDPVDPPPDDQPAPQPTSLLAVPLFHVTGLVPVMLMAIRIGTRIVMMHKWDPGRALELIERERVNSLVGVPTMSWDLLEHPDFDKRDTSSLVSVGGGGAPMPPELVKRIDRSFSKGGPRLGYGMTETNAYGPGNSGRAYLDHPESTGRIMPIVDMIITDDDGNELPIGHTGEIRFRGANLIRGYWNRPEATAETIVDGWLRTGDIGRIDEDGFLYISDRAKDMILRGGENVYCAEVESAIYTHPAVYEAAVYGLPHPRLGEEVAAHVMVKPGKTLEVDELQSYLREHIAGFKVPSVITIVTESLPRNASGKMLKRALRDELINERARP